MARYVDMNQNDLIKIFHAGSYDVNIQLNFYNHEADDMFIYYDTAREVINYLDEIGYNLLGFGLKVPYFALDDNYNRPAILESKDDFSIHWCHVSDKLIEKWQESLKIFCV